MTLGSAVGAYRSAGGSSLSQSSGPGVGPKAVGRVRCLEGIPRILELFDITRGAHIPVAQPEDKAVACPMKDSARVSSTFTVHLTDSTHANGGRVNRRMTVIWNMSQWAEFVCAWSGGKLARID
jgi:hypothetical protein